MLIFDFFSFAVPCMFLIFLFFKMEKNIDTFLYLFFWPIIILKAFFFTGFGMSERCFDAIGIFYILNGLDKSNKDLSLLSKIIATLIFVNCLYFLIYERSI